MKQLDRESKIAFARITTDLIEADFVVEADEMQFFEKIISKDGFSISDAMLVEAKKMDFAKALSILKTLDEESRKLVVDTLKQLSMSVQNIHLQSADYRMQLTRQKQRDILVRILWAQNFLVISELKQVQVRLYVVKKLHLLSL